MQQIVSDLPKDWEYARFRKIFAFGKGLNITKDDLIDTGVPVISYGQVHSKLNTGTSINDSLIRFVSSDYLKTDRKALTKQNDFIFADTSEDLDGVGNCVLNDRSDFIFAGYHSIIVRPNERESFSKYFAFQFLTDSWRNQLRSNVMGVKVFSVTKRILRNSYVISPPFSEQKAIADYLDGRCAEIDSIIADIEKQIELLKQYKKSLITETVTKGLDKSVPMKDSGIEWIGAIPEHWSIARIKDFSKLQTGTTPPNNEGINYDSFGIPWYTPGDFIEGSIILSKAEKFIDNLTISREAIKIYPQQTLLFVGIASIGKIGFSPNCCYSNQQITAIKPSNLISGKFLAYSILAAMDYIKNNALYTTVPIINNAYLGVVKIPITNHEEQIEIINYLDKRCNRADEVIKGKEELKQKLLLYKKSLIYEYVTGKKRVKEAM